MHEEVIVDSRRDREIRKKIITPGDYSVVPYEDSRCRITLTDVKCTNDHGDCEIEADSRIFSKHFDGNVLIGDLDFFIDKDFEMVLQRMCCGESCEAVIEYRNYEGKLVKTISFKVELREVTEEQLISDWGWQRLFEMACHHKERGVELVKEKRIVDAFRRFSKGFKMLVAIEPMDPEVVDEDSVQQLINLKLKLYNNLAHCQLQFNEFEAALELCNRALKLDTDNIKALYRRCLSYSGLNMHEAAWTDIQHVLKLDPNDKAAIQKANQIKPKIEKINKEYTTVIKKMFA